MGKISEVFCRKTPPYDNIGDIFCRLRAVLVYPNTYWVGMSNLGFQIVYDLMNSIGGLVCERAFLPERGDLRQIRTAESGSLLSEFDIIAFSISFENDYPNLLTIFDNAKLVPLSRDRGDDHPLVLAGGVACFLNPEPLAHFADCFLIGEAEELLPRFFEVLSETDWARTRVARKACLKKLAQNVPGVYVPEFYRNTFYKDGTLSGTEPLCDVPSEIRRVFVRDLSHVPSCSSILTSDTTFARTFLIEVGRGCARGCRFCSAGYVYRPLRFRPVSLLEQCMRQGLAFTDKIGLMGAAVSDFPGLSELCDNFLQRRAERDISISFSSLRADALALNPDLIPVLRHGRVKTATIAPEAGSERMRGVIRKGISEHNILRAADMLVSGGIPNLRLYFMIGLPTETDEDIEAIVSLCKKIKSVFLASSRKKGRIGGITVSVNPFVPKPFTPFQWAGMDDVRVLRKKIRHIRNGLGRVPNIRVRAENPRGAWLQALFSRGDRRVGDILLAGHRNKGNWAGTLGESPLDIDYHVCRERSFDEPLPWEIIDNGTPGAFLEQECRKGMN